MRGSTHNTERFDKRIFEPKDDIFGHLFVSALYQSKSGPLLAEIAIYSSEEIFTFPHTSVPFRNEWHFTPRAKRVG